MSRYSEATNAYVAELYARRDTGQIIQLGAISGENWEPQPNDCHNNVDIVCHNKPDHKAVRGWLYFDYANVMDVVSFMAHSVVETPDGQRFDITPPNPMSTGDQYPFIEANVSDEEFFAHEDQSQAAGDRGHLYWPRT